TALCDHYVLVVVSLSFMYPATPEIYTLSLHDALPIFRPAPGGAPLSSLASPVAQSALPHLRHARGPRRTAHPAAVEEPADRSAALRAGWRTGAGQGPRGTRWLAEDGAEPRAPACPPDDAAPRGGMGARS